MNHVHMINGLQFVQSKVSTVHYIRQTSQILLESKRVNIIFGSSQIWLRDVLACRLVWRDSPAAHFTQWTLFTLRLANDQHSAEIKDPFKMIQPKKEVIHSLLQAAAAASARELREALMFMRATRNRVHDILPPVM